MNSHSGLLYVVISLRDYASGSTIDRMLDDVVAEMSESSRRALLDELQALLQQTEPRDLTLTEVLALVAVLTPVAARHKGTPDPVVAIEANVVPNNSAAQLE